MLGSPPHASEYPLGMDYHRADGIIELMELMELDGPNVPQATAAAMAMEAALASAMMWAPSCQQRQVWVHGRAASV